MIRVLFILEYLPDNFDNSWVQNSLNSNKKIWLNAVKTPEKVKNERNTNKVFDIARGSPVFVADKLSVQNRAQLEQSNVEWGELRNKEGFKRSEKVFSEY